MRLVINLVTRGRPARALETLRLTLPLLAVPTTKIILSIDDDDEPTQDAVLAIGDKRVIIDSRPREDALGAKWDRCLDYPADVYLPMADYTPYVTPEFDAKILRAAELFPDGIGVVYTHMANFSFPSSQAMTRRLADMLGFMYPPYFPYWFVDHWVDDIARLIGRIAFADVQVKWPKDKIPTQEMREARFWATFFDSMRLLRRRQAHAIIDSPHFEEPQWRKDLLRRHHPLIEFRSQAINDHVRSWPETAMTPGGERYERMKAQALRMMAAEWPALEREIG